MNLVPEWVKLNIEDHIAIVTMGRPPLNLIVPQLYEEMTEVFGSLASSQEVKVAILTGAGRAFCAGGDVRGFVKRTVESIDQVERLATAGLSAITDCAVPVIGAVNGYALGGGLAFAAACDVVIASERAIFGMPEIDVGGLGCFRFLSRLVPEHKARRMALTGQRLSAQEIAQFGAIEQVVAHDNLMVVAVELAKELAAKSGDALRLFKQALNETERVSPIEAYRIELRRLRKLMESRDVKEMQHAFLEKRPPKLS